MESFAAYCRRIAEAGDNTVRMTLDRLPVETDWSYGAAMNHLTHQRAPAWSRDFIRRAHEDWKAEQAERLAYEAESELAVQVEPVAIPDDYRVAPVEAEPVE